MNLNFSLYRFVTEEEQVIFKQLIGDAFATEALLVSTKESKDQKEYIFIYNHPTEEMNNLVSFYGKVKKKRSKELELLEFATAQLTESMIKRYKKDIEDGSSVELKVANSIKYDLHEDADVLTSAVTENYNTSSQATYYFDCDGEKGNSKGSFCCILKKGTEYFILTAGHNLQNGKNEKTSTTKGSVYKLIKDANNFVELELIKDYTNKGYDAAVLKINKISQFNQTTKKAEIVFDITDASTKNDDITKSTDFYKNAIGFITDYYKNNNELDEVANLIGDCIGIKYIPNNKIQFNYIEENTYENSTSIEDDSSESKSKYDTKNFSSINFRLNDYKTSGNSGGAAIVNKKLIGIYIGTHCILDGTKTIKRGRVRTFFHITDLVSNYTIA